MITNTMVFIPNNPVTASVVAKLVGKGFYSVSVGNKSAFRSDFGRASLLVELSNRVSDEAPTRIATTSAFGLAHSEDSHTLAVSGLSLGKPSLNVDVSAIKRIAYLHGLGSVSVDALVRILSTKDHQAIGADGSTYCAIIDPTLDIDRLVGSVGGLSVALEAFASSQCPVQALHAYDAAVALNAAAQSMTANENYHATTVQAYSAAFLNNALELINSYVGTLLYIIKDRSEFSY
ncbi:hypothetical protein HY990_00495 [Candidatus Micrarchaeota archaeon]|nr:hypothetical protein [Candidatus Micrarchaeota archaeon]